MATPANSNAFPVTISSPDLADPALGRLNRAFQFIWGAVNALTGDRISTHFLSGSGSYTTVASSAFPPHFNSAGEAGTIAYDTVGNVYVAFAKNTWVRVGQSGTSTTF